jgi:hypothetical protein
MVQWFIKGITEDALFPQLVLVVWLVAPTVWALYTRWFLLRKVEGLYRERLSEKDAQIKRLERKLAAAYTKLLKERDSSESEPEDTP